MVKQLRYDDDLFKESTMTFGEHLEELRTCLFRAAIGLAIGFVIGMLIGNYVLEFFQAPLERALAENDRQIALEKRAAELAGLPAAQQVLPADDPQSKLIEKGWVYSDLLVDRHQLSQPATGSVETDAEAPKEAFDEKDLVKLRVWTPIGQSAANSIVTLGPMEAFMMWIKASLVAGVVISAPWVFYQIWAFVAAGLYPHEKHYVHLFLPFSLGLFLAGAATAYIFVFDPVLNFLFSFNRWLGIGTQMRLSEWMSFVLLMPLGFGVSFQLPLVMLFAERIGVVTVEMYKSKWRIAVLAIFVLAMILTPSGDPYSMLLMAAPLTILYWLGILLCRYMPKAPSPQDEFAEAAK